MFQVLRDVPKARKEIELHWAAGMGTCRNIVKIYDVYENTCNDVKCLMVVMEWCVHSLSFPQGLGLKGEQPDWQEGS